MSNALPVYSSVNSPPLSVPEPYASHLVQETLARSQRSLAETLTASMDNLAVAQKEALSRLHADLKSGLPFGLINRAGSCNVRFFASSPPPHPPLPLHCLFLPARAATESTAAIATATEVAVTNQADLLERHTSLRHVMDGFMAYVRKATSEHG